MQKYHVTFLDGATQIFEAPNLLSLLDKIVINTPYYTNDITNLQKIY